jgi:apolipoprotein N-acyltransferase
VPRLRLAGRSLTLGLLLSFLSGLATSLAFPPAGLWPVAFVSLIPFLWTLRTASPRRGLLLGLAFGLGCFGPTLYWILLFGELAWMALVVLCASSTALFGLFAPSVWRAEHPLGASAGLAALWVVIDWVRGAWPLGGFTWGELGVSQVPNRALLPLASVTGVWGVTFVVLLVNALVLLAAERGRGAPVRGAGSLALATGIVLAPVLLPPATADGREIRVAVLQIDVRPFRTLPPADEDRAVALALLDLHEQLRADPPDLAIWGESALDPGATEPEFFRALSSELGSVGVPTLAGSIQTSPRGLQNQVLAFDATGTVVDRYAKAHLVPYGEYAPFRDELSWLSALHQIPYDLTPGGPVHTLSVDGLPPFGSPVCFENSFGALDREMVRQGAGFLAVLTNNASYEMTAASAQHVQMSRMRAVEDARWVVHGAVSGISAFVDPSGDVVATRGLFDAGILRRTIRSSSEQTWYVRLGDWVPQVSLLFLAGLVLLPRRRSRDRGTPEPLPEGVRTLVIIPTYDERDSIEWVLEQITRLPVRVDILVVDDSSPDGTAELVRSFAAEHPGVEVLVRPQKAGLASAYLDGFRLALEREYDLVVEMDADLSHDPEELPQLLEAARAHDLTVGSRYVPGGSVSNWSRLRVALSRGGNVYARFMLGLPTHDATSGYRVYRRDPLRALIADPFHSDGYGFQIELVYRAWRLGYDIGEAPITFREREHGVSKISRRIVVEALWLVTVWGLRARFRARG